MAPAKRKLVGLALGLLVVCSQVGITSHPTCFVLFGCNRVPLI